MAATRDYVPGETECIHLIYPNENGKIQIGVNPLFAQSKGGMHTIACSPEDQVRPKCFSSETEAVNCPLCKQSAAFKRIELEQLGGMSEADKKARFYGLKLKQAATDKLLAEKMPELKAEIDAEAEEFAASRA